MKGFLLIFCSLLQTTFSSTSTIPKDPKLCINCKFSTKENNKLNEKLSNTKNINLELSFETINCRNINTIDDLLKIIDSNPYDEKKIYNIDLKRLHNIKNPLIALNSMIGMKHLTLHYLF